jgi:hypothetical protein
MESIFGSTSANAAAGNQGLTIAVSKFGELVNLKWPLPNYYDHLNYKTLYPTPPGWKIEDYNQYFNAQPRHGSFIGIEYTNSMGQKVNSWLRDSTWTQSQKYETNTSPIIVTEFYHPVLKLKIIGKDVILPNSDALVRNYSISWLDASLIPNIKLIFIANMAPCNKNPSNDPNQDWVNDANNGFANAYNSSDGTFVSFIPNQGAANTALIPSVFDTQVTINSFVSNLDNLFPSLTSSYDHNALLTVKDVYAIIGSNRSPSSHGMLSDYGFAQTMPDSIIANGQSISGNAAMLYSFHPVNLASAIGSDHISFQFAFGPTYSLAKNTYDQTWGTPIATHISNTSHYWEQKLATAQIPVTNDTLMHAVLQRILVNTLIGINRGSGSIGSSVCSSQPAYSQQWVRDAAIMGYMLDCAGYTQEAETQALFFNNVNRQSLGQDCQTPAYNDCYEGTWSQCYYADGRPSWAFDFEIDEVGWGVWLLKAHGDFLMGSAKVNYISTVYPSIKRSAIFLRDFEDVATGLQKPAKEDDVLWTSQSIYGASTTLLGLKSALSAAQFMNDDIAFQTTLTLRIAALENAIEVHKWGLQGNQYDYTVYGNFGARAVTVWPTMLHDTLHPKILSHLDSIHSQIKPFFQLTDQALNNEWWYTGKALTAMAYAWRSDPLKKPIVENYLRTVLKNVPTKGTHSYGETVIIRDIDSAGTIKRIYDNRVGQPSNHPAAWFYMTAQMLYGSGPAAFLEQVNNPLDIDVFPNPTSNSIQFQIPQNHSETKVELIDLFGKKIFSQTVEMGTNDINLKQLSLSSGIYLIRFITQNNQISKKIILN